MAYKIQIRSSLKADLPTLDVGEFGLCTDTSELFIGSIDGNIQIANKDELGILTNLATTNKTSLVNAINEIMNNLNNKVSSVVGQSETNGNITVGNQELVVYDDSQIKIDLNDKASISHTHTTADIQDIDTTIKMDGDVLTYDENMEKFISKPLSGVRNVTVLNDLSDVDTTTIPPIDGNILAYNGTNWVPTTNAIYFIDLNQWGIKNDGTDPINTTEGINNALDWAKNNGYSRCKLPKGQYLIDKDNHIEMVSNMTFDLFGCVVKKETNSHQRYTVINIENKSNATIIGGVVEGDKDTHDYTTIPGTHEWGTGINIAYSRNTKIDSVEIRETTGYGISVGSKYNHVYWVPLSELESGTFNTSGNPVTNINWVRNKNYFSLSHSLIQQQGYFIIGGNGYGSYGNGLDLTKNMINAYFFDDGNTFLGSITRRTFEPFYLNSIPPDAKKFKLTFRKNISEIVNSTTTIRADAYSKGVNIFNCYIHDCRALGIVGGGQYINIENCEIARIGGAAPGYGIDIEDGYNLNQHITIRNNYFHENRNGDIVIISARNVLIEMNKFNGRVSFSGNRGENYISQYNMYNGTSGSGSGEVGTFTVFRHDHFIDSQAFLSGNTKYENSTFENMNFILQSDQYLTTQFRNCRFIYNKPDVGWAWILRRGTLLFDSCEFNINCQWYYFRSEAHLGDWTKNKLVFRNNKFNTQVNLGQSVFEVDELILDNNTFLGKQDKTSYFSFWAKANKFKMTNNNVRDVYFIIEGKGSNTNAVINNNTVLIDKTSSVLGLDRSEFIRLHWFDKVFFQNNTINIPLATVTLRCFTIYAEKQLFVTGNYFNCDSGSNARMDFIGALRDSNNTTPIPSLVAVVNDNIIHNVTKLQHSSFINQLSAPIIGTDMDIG